MSDRIDNIPKFIGVEPATMWELLPPVAGIPPVDFLVHVAKHVADKDQNQHHAEQIINWWVEYWQNTVVVTASEHDFGAILRLAYDGPRTILIGGLSKCIRIAPIKRATTRFRYYGISLATDLPTWTNNEGWEGWDVWDTGQQVRFPGLDKVEDARRLQVDAIWQWLKNAGRRTENFYSDRFMRLTTTRDGHRKVKHASSQ